MRRTLCVHLEKSGKFPLLPGSVAHVVMEQYVLNVYTPFPTVDKEDIISSLHLEKSGKIRSVSHIVTGTVYTKCIYTCSCYWTSRTFIYRAQNNGLVSVIGLKFCSCLMGMIYI